MRSMYFVILAACGVERMPNDSGSEPDATTMPERGESSDTPAFGAPGGGALEPVEPTETTELALDDTGTMPDVTDDEPTEPEDTAGEPITVGHGCWPDESKVTVTYDAPVGATAVSLSGMAEATYGGFPYVTGMSTGSPVYMTVTNVDGTVTASYDVCTPDGSRWELSASYVDASGATHWSCEGGTFIENGTFTVTVDGETGPEPAPVSNGAGGCEHEFWQ